MRRSIIGLTVLTLVAAGAYAVLAGNRCSSPGATSKQASGSAACTPTETAAAPEASRGNIAGHFDPAMSGVCRFGCATKLEYNAKDVLGQPGAQPGKLTQCPVSGVVFAVDADRPRVRIGSDAYVTCCDGCAKKLERDPRHYLKV